MAIDYDAHSGFLSSARFDQRSTAAVPASMSSGITKNSEQLVGEKKLRRWNKSIKLVFRKIAKQIVMSPR